MAKSAKGGPEFLRWMAPLLDGLRALGGSAKPQEVSSWIARHLELPPTITEAMLQKSGVNRFQNQVRWARQYLVWQGLLDDERRGIWTLTPLGWKTHLNDASAREALLSRSKIQQQIAITTSVGPSFIAAEQSSELPAPEEQRELLLLNVLKSLPPYGFELVCGRLLREHGFEDVEVTQRSRDGGDRWIRHTAFERIRYGSRSVSSEASGRCSFTQGRRRIPQCATWQGRKGRISNYGPLHLRLEDRSH